jgi:hypothetical protein
VINVLQGKDDEAAYYPIIVAEYVRDISRELNKAGTLSQPLADLQKTVDNVNDAVFAITGKEMEKPERAQTQMENREHLRGHSRQSRTSRGDPRLPWDAQFDPKPRFGGRS